MATVALEHVSVRHDAVLLLDDVNLVVGDGEMIGVVGASGVVKPVSTSASGKPAPSVPMMAQGFE